MYLTSLTLHNVRALSNAIFSFANEPRVFLLVGVNGVGKSTALEAMRILLSNALPLLSESKAKPENFRTSDIQLLQDSLTAEMSGKILNTSFTYIKDAKRERAVEDSRSSEQSGKNDGDLIRGQAVKSPNANDLRNLVRDQTVETPDATGLIIIPKNKGKAKLSNQALIDNLNYIAYSPRVLRFPLAVFYSPHRSIVRRALENKRRTVVGQALAYSEALLPERNFQLAEFAYWWKTQEVTRKSEDLANLVNAFTEAVTTFLPQCQSLTLDRENNTLQITKGGRTIDVEQLSDGEKSVLTLTLDLTRRLFTANPDLPHPTKQGIAIVLIDEIDMHLHPTWQRQIVKRLEATFRRCQFIVSTHSPQVIGEVEPERISLIVVEDEEVKVYPVYQAFGMDSNWILREIMDADERDKDTKEMLNELFRMIARREVPEAQKMITELKERLNGDTAQLQQAAGTIQRIQAVGR